MRSAKAHRRSGDWTQQAPATPKMLEQKCLSRNRMAPISYL
jgi:hypothetical protein